MNTNMAFTDNGGMAFVFSNVPRDKMQEIYNSMQLAFEYPEQAINYDKIVMDMYEGSEIGAAWYKELSMDYNGMYNTADYDHVGMDTFASAFEGTGGNPFKFYDATGRDISYDGVPIENLQSMLETSEDPNEINAILGSLERGIEQTLQNADNFVEQQIAIAEQNGQPLDESQIRNLRNAYITNDLGQPIDSDYITLKGIVTNPNDPTYAKEFSVFSLEKYLERVSGQNASNHSGDTTIHLDDSSAYNELVQSLGWQNETEGSFDLIGLSSNIKRAKYEAIFAAGGENLKNKIKSLFNGITDTQYNNLVKQVINLASTNSIVESKLNALSSVKGVNIPSDPDNAIRWVKVTNKQFNDVKFILNEINSNESKLALSYLYQGIRDNKIIIENSNGEYILRNGFKL